MSRLLVPSGEVVLVPDKRGLVCFTLTVYDPATGLYIGMAHAPPSGLNLVGKVPQRCYAVETAEKRGLHPVARSPDPLFGPILWQNPNGVCGRVERALKSAVMETGRPEKGAAYLLTNCAPPGGQGYTTRAIPIEIVAVQAGDFIFEGDSAQQGMSGSPILQNGRLVGSFMGTDRDPHKRVGKSIVPMVNGLLGTEVKRKMALGYIKCLPAGGPKGRRTNSGARVNRATTERIDLHVRVNGKYRDLSTRSQRGRVYYQNLVNDAPKMTRLEAQVRRYEAGQISSGMFTVGSQNRSYQEALKSLWNYNAAQCKLALSSWVHAGVITWAQYRAILRGDIGAV